MFVVGAWRRVPGGDGGEVRGGFGAGGEGEVVGDGGRFVGRGGFVQRLRFGFGVVAGGFAAHGGGELGFDVRG